MVLAGSCLLPLMGTPAFASTWNIGDVFAGIASGSYNVYDNTGVFKETISSGLGGFTTGCAFNPGLTDLYTTQFSNGQITKFGDAHPHSSSSFATVRSAPESISFRADGSFFVGGPGVATIEEYDATDAFVMSHAVVATGLTSGPDWVDVASNQTTIFYSDGEGRFIRRFDTVGGQLADFAVLPGADQAFALRLLPPGDGTGGLIVADRANIKRLDGAGAVAFTYDVAGEDNWFSMNLDPNGTSFWAGDFGTNNFYRFNIVSGAVEIGPVNTGGQLFGLCLKGEPTAAGDPLAVTKTYRHTNTCFERDNDGDGQISEDGLDFLDNDSDGQFDEDPSECPDGTNPGDVIANDGDGTYYVESVFRNNGSVASYNPGQLYAVITANILQDTDEFHIGEFYDDCTVDPPDLLDLNPKKGGGRAKVVVEHADGTLEQVFDANTDDPNVLFTSDEDDTIVWWLEDLVAGDIVHLYVKFGPGKKSSGDDSCENWAGAAIPIDADPGFFEAFDHATLVVSPDASVFASGQFPVRGTWRFDLDLGSEVGSTPPADVFFNRVTSSESKFWPQNGIGALISIFGAAQPTKAACEAAPLSNAAVSFFDLGPSSPSLWLCAITNEGRYSAFRILSGSADPLDIWHSQDIVIEFVTWN